MSNVKSIHVEILSDNCWGATPDEVARYALCVEVKLEELYPEADVEVKVVDASGDGGGARVDGSWDSLAADTVNCVVQDVWEDGAFWSPESVVVGE